MCWANLRENMRARVSGFARALGANWGEVIYCGGIALALIALAAGAEHYRQGRAHEPEPTSLPAVDFAAADSSVDLESDEASEAEVPLALPEGARLLRGYSDAPSWNAALELWESHPSSDYRLSGDAVTCLLAGKVRAVERGGAQGGLVEIVSGGTTLRYCSIRPRTELKIGDEIEAGEALGNADVSMPGEANLGPHLHLELAVDGASADFAEWARSQSGD